MARLKKYIVRFHGHRHVLASSFDEAKKYVEKDLYYIHPNMNMKFKSISEEEE
tara:strand:- start:272 stop:430 length:159 start_codon:yes stop_codon:yes gene_type:complete